jgi:hypothetical protein
VASRQQAILDKLFQRKLDMGELHLLHPTNKVEKLMGDNVGKSTTAPASPSVPAPKLGVHQEPSDTGV